MQVLVVGAGVVGLAIARAAALAGHDVIVAEATGGIGNGVSSRNSEVIHAGIYYPTGSLRARHCVRGRRMLYEFCATHGVAHNKFGKLIVATDRGRPPRSRRCWRRAEERRRGPGAYRRQRRARDRAGIVVHRRIAVAGIRHHRQPRLHAGAVGRARGSRRHDRLRHAGRTPRAGRDAVEVQFGGRDAGTLAFDAVVNSAGLGAQALARAHRRLSGRQGAAPGARQGQLFRLCRPAGVLAADLSGAGRRRAWHACHPRPCRTHALRSRRRMDRPEESYTVDPRRAEFFYDRIRTYWPGLPASSLCRTIAASGRS